MRTTKKDNKNDDNDFNEPVPERFLIDPKSIIVRKK